MNDSSQVCSDMKDLAQDVLDNRGFYHYDWMTGIMDGPIPITRLI